MLLTIDIPYSKNYWQAHYKCDIPRGDVIGIMGRSGSGKSTLMRLISGIERAENGYMQFQGEQWLNETVTIKPQHRNIAYVTQECMLFPHFTVEANLTISSKKSRLTESERKALMLKTGVKPLLLKKPNELSGGQRQRVALVQALLQTPKLLLCDEPLSALDTQSKYELIDILKAFISQFNIPMIYISHSDSEIKSLADHCLIIENGEIVQSDKTSNIFSTHCTEQKLGHNTSITLPFKVVHWCGESHCAELHLIDKQGCTTYQKAFISSNIKVTNDILHFEIKSSEVVLAKEFITFSNLENYFVCNLTSIFEQDLHVTLCVEFGGHFLYSTISKRSFEHLNASQGDKLYMYYKIHDLT